MNYGILILSFIGLLSLACAFGAWLARGEKS